MAEATIEHEPWPQRALILAAVGVALGFLFDALVRMGPNQWTYDPLRFAAASFVVVGGVAFGFTLERLRPLWSVAFGVVCGLVVAGVFQWNGTPNGWNADEGWRLLAALVAIGIAAPLFQAARDLGRRQFDTEAVLGHVWINIVLWFAAWAFVALGWLLAQLLAELFTLIGIDLLRDLLRNERFMWMLVGGMLGAAIGLLRDRDKVLNVLQRVGKSILSVLAPVLAVGLVLFVLALPFTGLTPLWDQTKATTPILLACVIGSIVLINAVIGAAPEEQAESRILRWAAAGLIAVMLPLVIVAAISTGLRIDQYGFSPDRLWAIVFVGLIAAISVAYLATFRARGQWPALLRPTNVRLGMALCAVGLLLATPLINFGAISTRDQLARLNSGAVSPDKFDWSALAFDFGPSGRRALEDLKKSGASPAIRAEAGHALALKDRWPVTEVERQRRQEVVDSLRVLPRQVALPVGLRAALEQNIQCPKEGCILLYDAGADIALAVTPSNCDVRNLPTGELPRGQCDPNVQTLYRNGEVWLPIRLETLSAKARADRQKLLAEALVRGAVDIREVRRRQVFVDGEPVGQAFE